MIKRIANISNLLELIGKNVVAITTVQCKTKAFADIKETNQVTPEKFIESIQYLNESSLFKDAVDFFYEFTGRNNICIECGMKNAFLDEYFYVDCVIKDGAIKDVETKLRETIFDRMDEKIAV